MTTTLARDDTDRLRRAIMAVEAYLAIGEDIPDWLRRDIARFDYATVRTVWTGVRREVEREISRMA